MASLIQNIIGHQKQKDRLVSLVKEEALPSSFIFYGSEGIGRKQLVRGLLQVLNCQQDTLACGQCSSCIRSLEEKNEFIYEIKLEKKKIISVDQIRELHKFLSLKTLSGARFVLVDPADQLSIAASNSLLKVLEEPPPGTHFFLLTSKLSSLLPTIRSRSHIMRFQKLSEQDLSRIEGMNETSISWAGGRFDYAEQLQEDETVNYLNDSLKLFYSLLCSQPLDWKKEAPWFFTQDQWQNFCFHIWTQALEKRLHGHSENLEWIPAEPGRLAEIFDKVEDFKSDLSRNVDKLLAMENFYYQIKEGAGVQA